MNRAEHHGAHCSCILAYSQGKWKSAAVQWGAQELLIGRGGRLHARPSRTTCWTRSAMSSSRSIRTWRLPCKTGAHAHHSPNNTTTTRPRSHGCSRARLRFHRHPDSTARPGAPHGSHMAETRHTRSRAHTREPPSLGLELTHAPLEHAMAACLFPTKS
jgi:hypothetical protein